MSLEAGLASVSFSGFTLLTRAKGNVPGGLGPLANPARAFATQDQITEAQEGELRVY